MGIPIIGDIIDAVKDLGSELIVDKDKRNELNLELEKLRDIGNQRAHEQVLAQIATNTEEAKHGSIFVAGWRPFVGWVSGVGLAAQSIILPLISAIWGKTYDLDTTLLIYTLGGMLGIGAMRTYEKVKGVSTNDYSDTPASQPKVVFAPKKEVVQALPEDAPWSK